MEQEIDLTARHLIDWLRADLALGGARRLRLRATREFLAEPAPLAGSGLDEEDDIEALTTVGLLEVGPRDGAAHWTLRLRIEDPIGCHLPDDGSVPDDPEELALSDFEAAFLPAGLEEATVTLEAASAEDRRRFERLLAEMLAGRHGRRG
jgi:hypothetical protein